MYVSNYHGKFNRHFLFNVSRLCKITTNALAVRQFNFYMNNISKYLITFKDKNIKSE